MFPLLPDETDENHIRVICSIRKPNLIGGLPKFLNLFLITYQFSLPCNRDATRPTFVTDDLRARVLLDFPNLRAVFSRDKPKIPVIFHTRQRHRADVVVSLSAMCY